MIPRIVSPKIELHHSSQFALPPPTMRPSSTSTQLTSKSRHRDSRLTQRKNFRHNSPLVVSPSVKESTIPSLISHDTVTICDDELEERMDHLLNKNYTKTDPLTIYTGKTRKYIKDITSAQEQVIDRARKSDRSSSVNFADMEV